MEKKITYPLFGTVSMPKNLISRGTTTPGTALRRRPYRAGRETPEPLPQSNIVVL
jgi:hypothetical protein